MDWYATVFELIDMRSFSNLWYWIGLAVLWSSASHYVMGVPYDLIVRARRGDAAAVADLRSLVRVNSARILFMAETSGAWITALTSAAITGLAILGFGYGVEFAQAVFLMGVPLVVVGLLSLRTARRLGAGDDADDTLFRRLRRQRLVTQGIGVVSIFVTAIFGMYQNLAASVLGSF